MTHSCSRKGDHPRSVPARSCSGGRGVSPGAPQNGAAAVPARQSAVVSVVVLEPLARATARVILGEHTRVIPRARLSCVKSGASMNSTLKPSYATCVRSSRTWARPFALPSGARADVGLELSLEELPGPDQRVVGPAAFEFARQVHPPAEPGRGVFACKVRSTWCLTGHGRSLHDGAIGGVQ